MLIRILWHLLFFFCLVEKWVGKDNFACILLHPHKNDIPHKLQALHLPPLFSSVCGSSFLRLFNPLFPTGFQASGAPLSHVIPSTYLPCLFFFFHPSTLTQPSFFSGYYHFSTLVVFLFVNSLAVQLQCSTIVSTCYPSVSLLPFCLLGLP